MDWLGSVEERQRRPSPSFTGAPPSCVISTGHLIPETSTFLAWYTQRST